MPYRESSMAKDWIIQPPHDTCTPLAARWNVPPIVAQLLLNRGITTDGDARAFINPQLRNLHAPEELPGVRQAASIVTDALRRHDKIVLYGDYDVDGIAAVAILWHLLDAAGAPPGFYVPHRLEEGYGLNSSAIRNIAADGARLLVTVDCGIGAVAEAKVAAECGLRLVITDHHAPGKAIPECQAIVHPTVGGEYANPSICGAGVAFKLAWAIAQQLSGSEKVAPQFRERLFGLVPLVALGTIADVVPLLGENRIFARHGLATLKDTTNPGLIALMESAGLTGANVSGYDVGFKLAPRLNAVGRMGHARLAVEMLTRADAARAAEIADYLEKHNRARQAEERRIFFDACQKIEQHRLDSDACRGIVLASEKWHAGVIGIVAARVVERFGRPTVLIATDKGMGQGSARSIPPFLMHEALVTCGEHLLQHGGHAMAAGLRIDPARIPQFSEAFVQVANNRLSGADIRPKLRLDAEVGLGELDLTCVGAMLNLGPFGQGNPAPKFATSWVDLEGEPRLMGKKSEHLSAIFRDGGARLRCVAFGRAAMESPLKDARRCRIAFEPTINEFNGNRTVEVHALDFQFHGAEAAPV